MKQAAGQRLPEHLVTPLLADLHLAQNRANSAENALRAGRLDHFDAWLAELAAAVDRLERARAALPRERLA